MRAPFPGMDPFLESQSTWPAFHHQLVVALSEEIATKLVDRYQVRLNERRYTIATTVGEAIPAVEQREEYIEICAGDAATVVTYVDVASPPNKLTDSGRQAYLNTHLRAKDLNINLVDIDLVLQGQPLLTYPRERLPDWDYIITVIRVAQPERYELYPVTLEDKLPCFRVPVAAADRDVVLDLGCVVARAYERGGFGTRLNYDNEPDVGVKDSSRRRLRRAITQLVQQNTPFFTHDEIALAAYFIWKEQGCPEGRAAEHWRLALERLQQSRSIPPPLA